MPLRVMTFNIQCLVAPAGGADRSDQRAQRVAEAVRALPVADQPDVMAFNEVFSDSARRILVRELSAGWPHQVEKFDAAANLRQDSGLALFSRFPFRPLTLRPPYLEQTLNAPFASYNNAIFEDSLANKGVAVARFQHPEFGLVALALSHLQASYTEDEQAGAEAAALNGMIPPGGPIVYKEAAFAGARKAQLTSAVDFMENLLGEQDQWPPLLFVGDFNIEGENPELIGTEYHETVATGPLADFDDCWPAFISTEDPGLTESDSTGERHRLDYICLARKGNTRDFSRLVPHHMRTLHRSLSDHYALEAVLSRPSPNCNPAGAATLPTVTAPSGVRRFDLEIVDPGAYQWVRIEEPGTYAISSTEGTEYSVYSGTDLSDPWPSYDNTIVRVDELGLAQVATDWRANELPVAATVYGLSDGPFYIRVRSGGANPQATGTCRVGVYKYTGATMQTAIALFPQDDLRDPILPTGQLKPDDRCWFSAVIDRAESGAEHTSTFELQNDTGVSARFDLVDGARQTVATVSGTGRLKLTYAHAGRTKVYLVLIRSTTEQVAFKVGWRTALTFWKDDNTVSPFVLRCVDETGWDLAGDDEFHLRGKADGVDFLAIDWLDADSGEYYPRGSFQVPSTGFLDRIWIEGWESGDVVAGSVGAWLINPLPPEVRAAKFGVTEAVDTGRYRIEATLARERVRGGGV
jgi:endonuclease/exonuclease/phosphatase family metal-dependent hydrolase